MADRIKNYQQEADQITTLKAIRTDLGVTPSSYTPDATVVTKDRVVTFAQAEEELVVLSDIEKGVKQQVTEVDIAQKDVANIKALLQGHLYDYQTDTNSAYTKSVPAGAMPYAGLEKVGGKTVVWNQLVDSGTTTVPTISGRKYYTLIDGTASIVTADGTAITIVDDSADMVCDLTLMFGSGNEPSTTSDFTAIFGATHYEYNAGELLSAGVTEVESVGKNLAYYGDGAGVPSNTALANTTKRIFPVGKYVVGMTLGNYYSPEKITSFSVSDNAITFQTIQSGYGVAIPIDVIGGKKYTLAITPATATSLDSSGVGWYDSEGNKISFSYISSSYVTYTAPANAKQAIVVLSPAKDNVVTYTSVQFEKGNSATAYVPAKKNPLQTFPIPTAIRNLEGYGWSAGSVYNYVDFERKKFVKCVDRVDMGTGNWGKDGNLFFNNTLTSDFAVAGGGTPSNVICPLYETANVYWSELPDKAIRTYTSLHSAGKTDIIVRDDAISTTSDFKTAMDGVYLYYELATPIEVDISQYLTDDNLIQVEAGGTLTLPNQNGTDYQIPVPSEEEYMIDLQEAINNG